MANSKYEYVKSFEVEDEVMLPNLIVVRIDGRDFRRFSEVHEFEKPDDERALNLMNSCATAILEEYPDIAFSYGFSDEYSFVFKKTSKFYQRRASKLLSLLVSLFSSVYVTKWKEFFPEKELKYPPSYHSRVISCASIEVLQAYLAWRQNDCHLNNLHDTCLWMLVKGGETENKAHEFLKGTQKQQKNELLFQKFHINYKNLPAIYRQGSCIFKTKVEENVKYSENGAPVKRHRRKARIFHAENIAGRSFWNEHPSLLKEVGGFTEDADKIKLEYVRFFQFENKLMPSTWIVIRIDGCHFHRFSEVHQFEKPNDKQALNLMNSCAVAVLQEIPDIIFAYGVSDEYSFVFKKDSHFYQRRASEMVSVTVSFFSSMYVMKWKEFFPLKELKYPPSFDGRAVCYPSDEICRDYLAWRQVDCHINNQYNTCFWMLVNKKGKGKSEAQDYLKGTQAREKNELLIKEFHIEYNELEPMFRQGSLAFWEKEDITLTDENGAPVANSHKKVTVEHCDIIKPNFWEAHSSILESETHLTIKTKQSIDPSPSSSEVAMSSTTGQVIKCKAAVAWEAGKPLVIEEVEVAPPQANEVRVKILFTSLCHTDVYFWEAKGQTPLFPRIFGHEAGGIVESVGEGVTDLKPGDHVLPVFTGECKECRHCKSEESNMCDLLRINTDRGVMLSDGKTRFSKNGQPIYHFVGTSTFSEYTVIHVGCLAKINPAAPLDKVCVLSCGISTGLGATLNVAKPKKGQSVAVFGLGAVGLAAAEGARIAGASRIIGVDLNSSRFEEAKKFGVTEFVNPKDHDKPVQQVLAEMTDGGVDRAVECTGSIQAMISAFECVHDGWGVAVLVGVPNKDDSFKTHPMNLLNERTLKGTFFGNYKPRTDIPDVVEKYMNKELELDKFLTHAVTFSEINKAFEYMLHGKSIRCIIRMDA